MPTLRGLRRRGYPARRSASSATSSGCRGPTAATRSNCSNRSSGPELNRVALRRMAVLRPLEVVITNWPVDDAGEPVVEHVELVNNPENADDGTRTAPFTGALLDRAGRLHGRTAAEVLPADPGPRGAAARRVLRHVRPGSTPMPTARSTGARHLRPRDPRRQRAGRSQGQVDDALGVGRPCRRRRRWRSTSDSSPPRSRGSDRRRRSTTSNPTHASC